MNPLIDCHTHIHQHESIEHEEIIKRSLSSNVKIIVSAGTSIEDSIHSISLSEKFSNIYSGVGIHPTELKKYGENESKKIVKNFQWQKLCKDYLGLNIILKHQILAHPIKLLDKIHTHKLWPKLEVKLLN